MRILETVRARADGALGTLRAFDAETNAYLVLWHEDGAKSWHYESQLESVESNEMQTHTEQSKQDICDVIALRLVTERKARGLTQVAFATFLGISYAQLADLETARRAVTVATLVALCAKLKISPNEMLGIKR